MEITLSCLCGFTNKYVPILPNPVYIPDKILVMQHGTPTILFGSIHPTATLVLVNYTLQLWQE